MVPLLLPRTVLWRSLDVASQEAVRRTSAGMREACLRYPLPEEEWGTEEEHSDGDPTPPDRPDVDVDGRVDLAIGARGG